MREPIKAWLVDLGVITPERSQSSRLQRVLSIVLVVGILGVSAFAWVQTRQVQNLERLTSQDFTSFEWDAFKLLLRALQLNNALGEAVHHPDSVDFLDQTSTQYNLFVAQARLMRQRAPAQQTEDEVSFKLALSDTAAFIKEADPLLQDVPSNPSAQALRELQSQAEALRVRLYEQVIAAHDLRMRRSKRLVDEVTLTNRYFAVMFALVFVFAGGWGLSAMRNIRLTAQQQNELKTQFEVSSFNAEHDFLTGLANRRLLLNQLNHALASSKRNKVCGALIMIDLDNFKPVNDRYGHEAGDALLIEAALRIKKCVRDVDTVARMGGDEFVVLLAQLDGRAEDAGDVVEPIAQKLRAAVAEPYLLNRAGGSAGVDAVLCNCTASMGVAIFSDTSEVELLFQRADEAMYRAKQAGGNRFEIAV